MFLSSQPPIQKKKERLKTESQNPTKKKNTLWTFHIQFAGTISLVYNTASNFYGKLQRISKIYFGT